MLEKSPKITVKSPGFLAEGSKMSGVAEAHSLFKDIVGPLPVGSKIKEMLYVVALETRINVRRVRAIWNSETKTVSSDEMDAIRAAARKRKEANSREEFRTVLDQVAAIQRQVDEMAARLSRDRFGQARRPSGDGWGHPLGGSTAAGPMDRE